MLKSLKIEGFALIDELSLSFRKGLTVLTGETGAGKSIIVGALQSVLGERVDTAVVRSGENAAKIGATFTVSDEGALVINREIPREGRSRAVVNGTSTPLAQLRILGDNLVDLHGQHEHQTLLKVQAQLFALDSFAGLDALKSSHESHFRTRVEVIRKIRLIEEGEKERLARKDYLKFVVRELEEADIREGEEEELKEEERVLASAEKLHQTAGHAVETIYQMDGSLTDGVGRVTASLAELLEVDGRLSDIVELLDTSRTQLEEASHLLRDYREKVTADPQRLARISDRLALIGDLKKKYGSSEKEVLDFLHESRQELEAMGLDEEDVGTLKARDEELSRDLIRMANDLSSGRRSAAEELQKRVQKELSDLAMERVRFHVDFEEVPHNETGQDLVEFLISPNPGEPLLPLRKIVSGGELSRIMLALKRILAGSDGIPTLVFDEVDSGIGGRVAGILGKKLKEISNHHQVICITHLAPVAAFADQHILVEKMPQDDRTVVHVKYINDDDRVGEIARMMGGLELTTGIYESARELLEESCG
jgi:DNA repair protein RecN (Recombination protein N)